MSSGLRRRNAARKEVVERRLAVAGDDQLIHDVALVERSSRELDVIGIILDE